MGSFSAREIGLHELVCMTRRSTVTGDPGSLVSSVRPLKVRAQYLGDASERPCQGSQLPRAFARALLEKANVHSDPEHRHRR